MARGRDPRNASREHASRIVGPARAPHFLAPNNPRGPLAYAPALPLRNAGIAIKLRPFDALKSLDPSKASEHLRWPSCTLSARLVGVRIETRYTRRQP